MSTNGFHEQESNDRIEATGFHGFINNSSFLNVYFYWEIETFLWIFKYKRLNFNDGNVFHEIYCALLSRFRLFTIPIWIIVEFICSKIVYPLLGWMSEKSVDYFEDTWRNFFDSGFNHLRFILIRILLFVLTVYGTLWLNDFTSHTDLEIVFEYFSFIVSLVLVFFVIEILACVLGKLSIFSIRSYRMFMWFKGKRIKQVEEDLSKLLDRTASLEKGIEEEKSKLLKEQIKVKTLEDQLKKGIADFIGKFFEENKDLKSAILENCSQTLTGYISGMEDDLAELIVLNLSDRPDLIEDLQKKFDKKLRPLLEAGSEDRIDEVVKKFVDEILEQAKKDSKTKLGKSIREEETLKKVIKESADNFVTEYQNILIEKCADEFKSEEIVTKGKEEAQKRLEESLSGDVKVETKIIQSAADSFVELKKDEIIKESVTKFSDDKLVKEAQKEAEKKLESKLSEKREKIEEEVVKNFTQKTDMEQLGLLTEEQLIKSLPIEVSRVNGKSVKVLEDLVKEVSDQSKTLAQKGLRKKAKTLQIAAKL